MSVYEHIETFGLRGEDAGLALPLPAEDETAGAVAEAMDALASVMGDTALEPMDLEPLLWGVVNAFHARAERIGRERREIESDVAELIRQQDGSEIASVQLETAQAHHARAEEREDAVIAMREAAAARYEAATAKPWSPRSGSRSGKIVTASVIDARDQLRAAQAREAARLDPPGEKIAIAGDAAWSDHASVWDALDRARDRVGRMVLHHGGQAKGVDHIAALWARERGIPCIVHRPDFRRDRKAAPFRRNDRMIDAKPRAVILFPSTNGITLNLGQKAEAAGVPVWKPQGTAAEAGA